MRFWRFDNLESAPLTVHQGSVICPDCSDDLILVGSDPYFAENSDGLEFLTHFRCSCCTEKFGLQGVIQ